MTLPVTIREQIYSELLTSAPPCDLSKEEAPSSSFCLFLTLNHHVNEEFTRYLKRRLLVLIKANDPKIIGRLIKGKSKRLPFISQLRSYDGTIKKLLSKAPMGMAIEFYVFEKGLDSVSFPVFPISAKSIETLLSMS
jgi:hypothetical protein